MKDTLYQKSNYDSKIPRYRPRERGVAVGVRQSNNLAVIRAVAVDVVALRFNKVSRKLGFLVAVAILPLRGRTMDSPTHSWRGNYGTITQARNVQCPRVQVACSLANNLDRR